MPVVRNRRFRAAVARCPPMLGPACAAAAGSGLAWRVADSRLGNQVSLVPLVLVSLVVVVLLIFRLLISIFPRHGSKKQQNSYFNGSELEDHQDSFWRFVILLVCVCFCLTFWQTKALLAGGRYAQERLGGRIARENGRVIKVVTAADKDSGNDWGRVDVRLSDGSVVQLSGEVGRLLPGQTISFQARFSLPSAQRNPGGFDEKIYLARSGIFLKADLFLNRLQVIDKSTNMLSVGALRARSALTKAALTLMPAEEAGLLLGVLTGDTAQMTKQDKAAFQAAGISHITAVSGANVAFLLAPMAYLLLKVLRRRSLRILGLLLFVFGFGFLTAWEASVTRAIIMVVLTLAGKLGRRRSDPLNALLFAATLMLLSKPLLILSFSFQLSFLATVGILLASERMSERLQLWLPLMPAGLRTLLSLNLSVQLTVLPLQLLVTGIFSPLSIVANLPALPLAEGISLAGRLCFCCQPCCCCLWPPKYAIMTVCLRILAWPVRWLLQALIRLAIVFAAAWLAARPHRPAAATLSGWPWPSRSPV
ncbi:MAG: ComEC/Rec2 family competence protein [Saccharofermentanales bacterium]